MTGASVIFSPLLPWPAIWAAAALAAVFVALALWRGLSGWWLRLAALAVVLAARGIRALMVGGVTTSMCVESSVRDAAQRDIRTFVVREAVADFDPDRHAASLRAMAFGFARVIGANEAAAAIAAGEACFPA